MNGTLLLGWRNIWRNRRRTLISMSAIGVGLFLVVFYSGIVGGLLGNAKNELDNAGMGHVEVFAKGYRPKRDVAATLAAFPERAALQLPADAELGTRVLARGLATSAHGSEAIQLNGVDFAAESLLSAHLRQVKQGALPVDGDGKGVLVGEELATRLNLKVGGKLRLMVQRADTEMGADLFRVRGVFHSIAPSIGQRQVYVSQAAARELLGLSAATHQAVIQLSDPVQADAVAARLKVTLGEGYEVLTWAELVPVLKRMEAFTDTVVFFLAMFVYLLVGLGVLNTMLMSVLERTREFGVLLALGTRPARIVRLVIAESFWIATLSVVVGAAAGALLTWHFSQSGFHITGGGESFQLEGATIGTLVKTRFNPWDVVRAASFVYVMALIVGIYPATRITRLQPAEALRRT
ncbi:MAG: ABC transporter permease [Archangiaceae bacterium]|nr:ABC transporter permease [Archangiaceae bacterium]